MKKASIVLIAALLVEFIICLAVGSKMGAGAGAVASDIPGFARLLDVNPKSDELGEAFKLYEQKTGKSCNEMTFDDISQYVKIVRNYPKK